MNPTLFVAKIEPKIAEKLRLHLLDAGFTMSDGPYLLFTAKKPALSISCYKSGKLVVQGRGTKEFVEFTLEPNFLTDLPVTMKTKNLDLTPRIGVDESGKGDFFGPLVVAAVLGDEITIPKLSALGIRDSKTVTDTKIFHFAKEIKKICPSHLVVINCPKYNELYKSFLNLNDLLAFGHATAIDTLSKSSGVKDVLIDQFAKEHVVKKALKKKGVEVNLTQRTKAEDDLVVAAASILARDRYLFLLNSLSQKWGVSFPKGINPKTLEKGREFVRKHGAENLFEVCKLHFKTLDQIT